MSGRLLDAVRMVPPLLSGHLGEPFSVAAPDLAALTAMYRRAPTLIEHQQLACDALGSVAHRPSPPCPRASAQELLRTDDRERLLGFARRWPYGEWMGAGRHRSLRDLIGDERDDHKQHVKQFNRY